MTSNLANRMDLINESFVLLTTYHLYQFTEFMTDLQNRNLVGKSLVALNLVYIMLNIGTVVAQTLVVVVIRLKLRMYKFRQSDKIKKQRERMMDELFQKKNGRESPSNKIR